MKRTSTEPPVRIGNVVLTAIVEVEIEEQRVGRRVFFRASKRPAAIRVRTPDREFRIELGG